MKLLKMFTMTDARGRESVTLMFVSLSWLATWLKFIFAGATLPILDWTLPPMTATEFGLAIAGILSIWLAREWKEKKESSNGPKE